MTENRNGFVVEAELRQVSGMVERETAKDMIVRYSPGAKRITVGADKALVLCPARVSLCRLPLGPCPLLHRLRSQSPGLVHQLRSYYGRV
jgi:hypothetical protein